MTRVKNVFIYWREVIWDRGGNFRKLIDRGSHRGASHRGTWTGRLKVIRVAFKFFQLNF